MKKTIITLLLTAVMIFTLAGCGGKEEEAGENQGGAASQYAQALEVLNEVVKAYAQEDLFAIYGGDQENAVMDAPGKFDIAKTEEMSSVLGLPEDQAGNIDDAASMVHMMNANTFTGAVYGLKEGTDVNAFVDSVKAAILARQWICGMPDTLIIIQADDKYVITAFGEAGIIETFKTNALSVLSGAQVIVEAPVV